MLIVGDASSSALGSLSRLRERVGERVPRHRDCQSVQRLSPNGESPHPPRAGRCFRIARGASASPASGRGEASQWSIPC